MSKCIGVCDDGCASMTGKNGRILERLLNSPIFNSLALYDVGPTECYRANSKSKESCLRIMTSKIQDPRPP